MKKDFGVKTWLYPMPVLMIATLCGEIESALKDM